MSTTPIQASRPLPTTTPKAPPPSLAHANTTVPPAHVPRSFPAQTTSLPTSTGSRDVSQAPSDASNGADKQFALVHQPSNGYAMDRAAAQVKEGAGVYVNAQVVQGSMRMGGAYGMERGKEGQGVGLQMQQQAQEQAQRPAVVPSSQDEPDVEDADADAEDGDEERTLADEHETRESFLPSATQFAASQDGTRDQGHEQYEQYNYHQQGANRWEYGDHGEAYDDMGEGVANNYARQAAQATMDHGHFGVDQRNGYYDDGADQLDEDENEAYNVPAHMQRPASHANTRLVYDMHSAEPALHQGTAHYSAQIASDKARGQYRPPGPANNAPPAQAMANNGFIPPIRTGPPAGNRPPPAQHKNNNHMLHHTSAGDSAPHVGYHPMHSQDHGRGHADAQARHAEQDIHSRQRAQARDEAHVHTEMQGGRSRLVRRAGSKRDHEMAFGDTDRSQNDEEEGNDYEFDPTDELKAFDYDRELVQAWNEIQKDVPAAIMEYSEALLKNCFNVIFEMSKLFYKLNHDAGEDLEEGVNKIKEEEKNQKEKREVILGFQKSVRQVAIQLSQFGQSFSSAQASMGRSGSKNSFH